MAQVEKNAVDRLKTFVQARRRHLGWRQQDVADRTGLSLAWVGMLESGRLKNPPRTETLIKLSKGLHLRDETPGALLNFLQLVIAGSFAPTVVRRVANGKADVTGAMSAGTRGKGLSKLAPGEQDLAAAIYHNTARRSQNLQLILKLIADDLSPDDLALAKMLLERLYDGALPAPRETED
ncbi:MAG TPA: helix-turn-helix transcriptional regulator [Oscillatoriaceae cyanobacterium]